MLQRYIFFHQAVNGAEPKRIAIEHVVHYIGRTSHTAIPYKGHLL